MKNKPDRLFLGDGIVMSEEQATAGYHSPMTSDNQMGESWLALGRERQIAKFCERTGLQRSEVTVVINTRAHIGIIQWIGAVPKEIRVGRGLE